MSSKEYYHKLKLDADGEYNGFKSLASCVGVQKACARTIELLERILKKLDTVQTPENLRDEKIDTKDYILYLCMKIESTCHNFKVDDHDYLEPITVWKATGYETANEYTYTPVQRLFSRCSYCVKDGKIILTPFQRKVYA